VIDCYRFLPGDDAFDTKASRAIIPSLKTSS
jgi:hypothetical protein